MRSRIRSLLTAAALLTAVCSAPLVSRAMPQAAQSGSARLESIEVTGSSRFTSEQIVTALGIKPGWIVDREALQGGADKIAALGVFKTVQYKFSSSIAGVRVVYQVTDAPGISVDFDNFPWVSDAELSAALTTAGILFDGKAPLTGTVLDRMSNVIEKTLDQHNIHATVSHTVVTRGADAEKIQQFRADDVDLTINSVTFSDALARNSSALQERVSDLIGKPYSRSVVELFEFEQARPVYLSRSFLRVAFPQPIALPAPGNSNPTSAKLDLTLPVVPGPSFQWAGVTWSGNTALAKEELDRLVDFIPGDPIDGNKLEAMWQRVETAARQRGYLDAKLDVQPHFDDAAGRVSFTAAFNEGPQYHMGKLVLTGLSLEGERRIRKAWSIEPDATFNEAVYQDFLDHGIKQAFAGLPVHYEKIGHFLQEDSTTGKVDVLLDFQ